MLSTVLHLFPHSTFMNAYQYLEFISRACLSIILTTVIKSTIDDSTVASKLRETICRIMNLLAELMKLKRLDEVQLKLAHQVTLPLIVDFSIRKLKGPKPA